MTAFCRECRLSCESSLSARQCPATSTKHTFLSRDHHIVCKYIDQGQIGKQPRWSDFNTTLGGTTAPFAVHDWYAYNRKLFFGGARSIESVDAATTGKNAHKTNKGRALKSGVEFVRASAEFVHMTSATYPCSDCCDGGDGVNDLIKASQ